MIQLEYDSHLLGSVSNTKNQNNLEDYENTNDDYEKPNEDFPKQMVNL